MKKEYDLNEEYGMELLEDTAIATSLTLEETAAIILSLDDESTTCPKCDFDQPKGSECVRCGVVFKKYKKNNAARTFNYL